VQAERAIDFAEEDITNVGVSISINLFTGRTSLSAPAPAPIEYAMTRDEALYDAASARALT
jgi:hypothetical protein